MERKIRNTGARRGGEVPFGGGLKEFLICAQEYDGKGKKTQIRLGKVSLGGEKATGVPEV